MLAGALCRLANDAPRASPLDMPHLARVLRRTLVARNAAQLPHVRALSRAFASALQARRSYATTTRATKPTATVKKAVKTAVAKKPAPKKTATTTKKAAPKKKPATKTVAKKTAKKTSKKPAAKKAAPKKRAKKVLTPEEQLKAKIRELRKTALKEPVTYNTISALNAFIAEKCSGPGNTIKFSNVQAEYKNLTPAEREVSLVCPYNPVSLC
jgi:outer membrane biosynthesis protein TonB